jgi:hypothetical protein
MFRKRTLEGCLEQAMLLSRLSKGPRILTTSNLGESTAALARSYASLQGVLQRGI